MTRPSQRRALAPTAHPGVVVATAAPVALAEGTPARTDGARVRGGVGTPAAGADTGRTRVATHPHRFGRT